MRARLESKPNSGPAQIKAVTDEDMRVQGAGIFEVDVHYIDDDTDKETLVAKRTIEVPPAKPKNEPMTHFINHTGDVVRAIVALAGSSEGFPEGKRKTGGFVNVRFVTAASEYNLRYKKSAPINDSRLNQLRVKVNGERLKLPDGGMRSSTQNAIENAYDGNTRIRFSWVEYLLPVIWGTHTGYEGELPNVADHPGVWELTLRSEDGVKGRTFRFEIKDGKIVPHPEEAAGFYIGLGGHLATVTIPSDETFETYVDPDAPGRLGLCYGHKPSSPELKQAVAELPRLGNAPGSKK